MLSHSDGNRSRNRLVVRGIVRSERVMIRVRAARKCGLLQSKLAGHRRVGSAEHGVRDIGRLVEIRNRHGSELRRSLLDRKLRVAGIDRIRRLAGNRHNIVAGLRRRLRGRAVLLTVLGRAAVCDCRLVGAFRLGERRRHRLFIAVRAILRADRQVFHFLLGHRDRDDGFLALMVLAVVDDHLDLDHTGLAAGDQVIVTVDRRAGRRRLALIDRKMHISLGAVHKLVEIDSVVIARVLVGLHRTAVRRNDSGVGHLVDDQRIVRNNSLAVMIFGLLHRHAHIVLAGFRRSCRRVRVIIFRGLLILDNEIVVGEHDALSGFVRHRNNG